MKSGKIILISQIPLPYSKIGSWSTLYDNFLKEDNGIDVLICPKPEEEEYSGLKYEYFSTNPSFSDKVLRKLKLRLPWHKAVSALKKVIQPHTKYVIHIIDNYGLCMALSRYLEKNKIRPNFYIQYFYHGYPPFKDEQLYSKVDELTLLTYKSYQKIKTNVNTFPCRVSILHNGIDTSKFYPLSLRDKQNFRESLQIGDKKVFVWCSKDLPKKGLDFILDIWKKIHLCNKNTVLLVVGATRNSPMDGVQFFGKIPNQELPKYYQMADCYLFPTLCHEGFGLSLIEALHCGCYCIASSMGGVPEVLQYGKLGKLIENPHFQQEWEAAILDFLNQKEGNNIVIPKTLYSTQSWNSGMNTIIENAKNRMQ